MKKTSSFSCTQQELYLACRLGWKACKDNLAAFAAFKSRYTEGYIAERLAEVAAAEAIPNDKTRRDKPKTDKVLMQDAADVCMARFQALKAYIEDAFPANLLKLKLEAAGQAFYNKACQYNRDALNNLNLTAVQFIQNNQAALMANENMPAAFLTQYQTDVAIFNDRQADYLESVETSMEITGENTVANNEIYAKLVQMCKDAQVVFKNDPILRRRMTFSDLLSRVAGSGVAGLRGTVTDFVTGLPVANATVTINSKNKMAVTDELGKYDIPQLAGGFYTVVFAADGFMEMTFDNIEVKTSIYNKLDAMMEPLVVAV